MTGDERDAGTSARTPSASSCEAEEMVTMEGRGIKGLSEPVARGEVMMCRQPVSFFGDFDISTGICINPELDIMNGKVAGKILVFPSGAGSTVGSYSLVNMALNGVAPGAIIVNSSDSVILLGCCVAEIPHVHMFEVDVTEVLENGMTAAVNSEAGTVKIIGSGDGVGKKK